MKNKHTLKQQLVFISSLQKSIDNKFLDMEVRSRMNGTDLAIKKYIKDFDPPEIDRQDALEYLWTYIRLNNLKHDNLINAVADAHIAIESELDAVVLMENLNSYLEQINLPKL